MTETETWADFVVSATLVAVIVTLVFAVTVGAVKTPAVVIVPWDACHVTVLGVALVTVAVNVCVCPEASVADVGEIVTVTAVAG
jgi:hypothetical protein